MSKRNGYEKGIMVDSKVIKNFGLRPGPLNMVFNEKRKLDESDLKGFNKKEFSITSPTPPYVIPEYWPFACELFEDIKTRFKGSPRIMFSFISIPEIPENIFLGEISRNELGWHDGFHSCRTGFDNATGSNVIEIVVALPEIISTEENLKTFALEVAHVILGHHTMIKKSEKSAVEWAKKKLYAWGFNRTCIGLRSKEKGCLING